MQANYNNKQKVKWENRLELKYGLQSSRSDSLHSFKSTEDLIRLTSNLVYKQQNVGIIRYNLLVIHNSVILIARMTQRFILPLLLR